MIVDVLESIWESTQVAQVPDRMFTNLGSLRHTVKTNPEWELRDDVRNVIESELDPATVIEISRKSICILEIEQS